MMNQTNIDDGAHDATLMKSLGRGSTIHSGGGGLGRGGSSILSAGRGVAVGRGVPLSQGRGRGTPSIGRGRGGPILHVSRAIVQQSDESDSSENDEESDDDQQMNEDRSDSSSEEEIEAVTNKIEQISMNQSSANQNEDYPELRLEDSRFVQLTPSPLAQSLLQRLTDTSFMYSFLSDKKLSIFDYHGHDVFKFDVPSPDDAAFSARDQSKISHKAENVKFKPIVKQQGANKPKAKSGLTVELAEVDKKPAKDEAKTPTTPFSFKPKGPAPTDESKQRVNVVIIGHVDAGKSTLMGHLLVQTGMVSDKQLHKFKKESQEKGKASFAYAWVLDEHPEERERGVTIDVGVRYFDTPNRHVTILDAPGHRDFIPNMITGASQADMAILVVDASIGEFESGFQSGGQTKEHLILARSLGVSEVLVVVNKLDMVNWDQERFNYISEQIGLFMKQIGYRGEKDAVFIPGSGLNGINLVDRASKTAQDKKNPAASEAAKLAQWYDGPSIVEHIDHFTPANRDVEKPFRMSINDVYKTLQTGVTVAGRVDSGHISIDDHLLVVPLNEMCVVKTILRHKGNVQTAYAGDNVELGLGKIDINMLNVGSILCDPAHPIQLAKKFEARIATFEMDIPITKGAQVVLHIHNINVPAVVSRLKCTLNKHQEVLKKKPRVLSSNTTAIVEVKLSDKQTIPLERYADFPTFGRFMLRANGKTVAAGMATEILDSKSSKKSKAE